MTVSGPLIHPKALRTLRWLEVRGGSTKEGAPRPRAKKARAGWNRGSITVRARATAGRGKSRGHRLVRRGRGRDDATASARASACACARIGIRGHVYVRVMTARATRLSRLAEAHTEGMGRAAGRAAHLPVVKSRVLCATM